MARYVPMPQDRMGGDAQTTNHISPVGSMIAVKGPKKVEIASINARLEGVSLPMGLVLDRIDIVGQNLQFEHKPFKVVMPQPGELVVTLTEKSLEAFLNKEAPGGMSGFEVTLVNDRMYIQGNMQMILTIRGAAVCTLRIVDGTKLYVDLESVDVLGVGAKHIVQKQLDGINPVIDASDLPLDAKLTSATVAKGEIVLRGEVLPKSD